ncbi:hypothetical protein [Pseudomonas syringae]|uniref:hypothetical protein n=1 Tax=Pseudomonas syringae TaxID=317 RepID=UPI001363ECF1|nr:hypothetical protein [Pseudomonas syringae]
MSREEPVTGWTDIVVEVAGAALRIAHEDDGSNAHFKGSPRIEIYISFNETINRRS